MMKSNKHIVPSCQSSRMSLCSKCQRWIWCCDLSRTSWNFYRCPWAYRKGINPIYVLVLKGVLRRYLLMAMVRSPSRSISINNFFQSSSPCFLEMRNKPKTRKKMGRKNCEKKRYGVTLPGENAHPFVIQRAEEESLALFRGGESRRNLIVHSRQFLFAKVMPKQLVQRTLTKHFFSRRGISSCT